MKDSLLKLAFLLVTVTAWAHPHEWVDWAGIADFKEKGTVLDDLRIEMTWDEVYSALVLNDFPQIKKGKVLPVDLLNLSKTYGILARGDVQNFIHVKWNGKDLKPAPPVLLDVRTNAAKVTFIYRVGLDLKLESRSAALRLSVYDPTYYTDMGIRGTDPAATTLASGVSLSPSFEQDTANPYYYGQVYPEVIVFAFER